MCGAAFVAIGHDPNTQFVKGQVCVCVVEEEDTWLNTHVSQYPVREGPGLWVCTRANALHVYSHMQSLLTYADLALNGPLTDLVYIHTSWFMYVDPSS
jgi:hypothetical protein